MNTPIITQLDCENTKELFQITSLSEEEKIKWITLNNEIDSINFENTNIKLFFSELNKKKEEVKEKKKEEILPKIANKDSELDLEYKSNYNSINVNANRITDHIFIRNNNNNYGGTDASEEIFLNSDLITSDNFSNLFYFNDVSREIVTHPENSLLTNKTGDNSMSNKKHELDLSCDFNNPNKELSIKDLIENKNLFENYNEEDDYIIVTRENKFQVENLVYEKIFSNVSCKAL